jgi:hypothetical protein
MFPSTAPEHQQLAQIWWLSPFAERERGEKKQTNGDIPF